MLDSRTKTINILTWMLDANDYNRIMLIVHIFVVWFSFSLCSRRFSMVESVYAYMNFRIEGAREGKRACTRNKRFSTIKWDEFNDCSNGCLCDGVFAYTL